MENRVIETNNLSKKYQNKFAVKQLNLSIKKGEVFGLLGPNGSGKSTTILMLLGLSDPSSGTVNVCGIDSTRNPAKVKSKVGYLPEDVGFYNEMSAIENLIYTARLNGLSYSEAKNKATKLLERVGLKNEGDKQTSKYSRGMRQRLGLADVLIKNPEVIILDEPISGIDPQGVKDFLNLIVQLSKEEQITVLFSSHNLHQVQQVCDRIGLFIKGKLIAIGTIDSLIKALFNKELFQIELDITAKKTEISNFISAVEKMNGVNKLTQQGNKLLIGCSENLTSAIAKLVIDKGLQLNYLKPKEFGLDEIYERYFEGGDHDQ